MQLAVKAGLQARVDPNALRIVLRTILLTAIRSSPGGDVLITASSLGRQLRIGVMDDAGQADQRTRESLAREAGELIALQGGSVIVEARPGRGTTVTIRLPSPAAPEGETETPIGFEQVIREDTSEQNQPAVAR